MSRSGVVIEGYLTKAPPIKNPNDSTLSKWHPRWFIIRENSNILEYWEDERMMVKKGALDMSRCCRIRVKVDCKKYPFLFSLLLPDREWFFAAENERDKENWIENIAKISPPSAIQSRSETFSTSSLKPDTYKDSSKSNTIGGRSPVSTLRSLASVNSFGMKTTFMAKGADNQHVFLHIAYPNLELLEFSNKEVKQYWPITYLRGYGQDNNTFTFEAGRKCPSGEGVFEFELQPGDDLFASLDHIVACSLETGAVVPAQSSPPPPAQSSHSRSSISTKTPSGGDTDNGYTKESENDVYTNAEEARLQYKEASKVVDDGAETTYTYVQTNSYVQVNIPEKAAKAAAVPQSTSNYVQVDIKRTEALSKALNNKSASAGRQTRHDTTFIGDSPSRNATLPKQTSIPKTKSSSSFAPSLSSNNTEDDLDDLLNSVEEEIANTSVRSAYENVVINVPPPSPKKYVNMN